MVLYAYRCDKCNLDIEKYFDIDKRRKTIKCNRCGGVAYRLFGVGASYIARNWVGDIWDKKGVTPVSDKNPKAKKANIKRVEKMREDKESRIDMAREKRRKEGRE